MMTMREMICTTNLSQLIDGFYLKIELFSHRLSKQSKPQGGKIPFLKIISLIQLEKI